jgi:hypothetical protein
MTWLRAVYYGMSKGREQAKGAAVIERLRARQEWMFLGVLPRADRPLAAAWWFVLLLRGLLPALFAIAMGVPGRCSYSFRCCRRCIAPLGQTWAAARPRGSTTS